MKNQQQILIPIVVAIIVGAMAFYGGMQYQKSQTSSRFAQFGGQNGQRAFGRNGGQGRFNGAGGSAVVGQIISQDDKSITVKLQDGSSKIVVIPDSATVSKMDTGSKTDLKTGERVAVFGTANSDGSVTAQNVQLNPMFRGAGGNGPTASSSPAQ